MPPSLPKIALKMLERSKREAKDDSEVKSKKIDPDISRVMRKVKVQKISKDNSEILEKKVKQQFKKDKPSLVKTIDKAKDDSDLLKLKSAVDKLQGIDILKLKVNQLNKHTNNIGILLNDVMSMLDKNSSIAKPLGTIVDSMKIFNCDMEKTPVPDDGAIKIMNSVKQIIDTIK